jgi:hypothetical protein
LDCSDGTTFTGANPMNLNYNASAVKNDNATGSLRVLKISIFFYFEKTQAL